MFKQFAKFETKLDRGIYMEKIFLNSTIFHEHRKIMMKCQLKCFFSNVF